MFKSIIGSILVITLISALFEDSAINAKKKCQDFNDEEKKLDPIVNIKINVTTNMQSLNSNIKVSWSATPTNIASNSWIGIYPFAQKPTSMNLYSNFLVNKKKEGNNVLQTPKEAGVFEIRYIQDSNLHTIASNGPIIVNPSDSLLTVSNKDTTLGENIKVIWELNEETSRRFTEGRDGNKPLETLLCLNIIGSYDDDCYWTKLITNNKGVEQIKMPKFAGYFVLRMIAKYQTWKVLPEVECLVVSEIIKVSHPDFKILPHKNESVVASIVKTNWHVENANKNDWIGFYSVETSEVFTRSASPIMSIKVKAEHKGTFQAFIPPNKPAGPYVFIYFRNHVPVAVSDLINLQQPRLSCPAKKNSTMSKIKHLIIICTENHSFDSYFGNYCEAEANSNPKCTKGSKCCERPPEKLQGLYPVVLNDNQNLKFSPSNIQNCEKCEINSGKMDGFVKGCFCSDPENFAVADNTTIKILHDYARKFALADHYFQPSAGASSQNNMFFARASYVFKDNAKIPIGSIGSGCWYLVHGTPGEIAMFYDPSITSLLSKCGYTLRTYAEGYKNAKLSFENTKCFPDGFDASDIPFGYYAGVTDNPRYMADYEDFKLDVTKGTLPEVSFIKPLGKNTGHPYYGNIQDENNFIMDTVEFVLNSDYAEDTLVVWVPDESGGFYDHVSPPKTNNVDGFPYGPRIPFIAFGKFAKKDYISHVEMEHSSIVKFIEWNWLGGKTGQLNTRDTNVNSIGDMIDPKEAGIKVPN